MTKIASSAQLGSLIRHTRKIQKLTQEQLAAQTGVGIRFLQELERGKVSSQIGKMLQILAMLGLEIHISNRSEFYRDDK